MSTIQAVLAQERFLRFLVDGRREITEEDARYRMNQLRLPAQESYFCVVEFSLHLDLYPADQTDALLVCIQESVVRYLNRTGWMVSGYIDSRNSLILLFGGQNKEVFSQLDRVLSKLANKLMTEQKIVIYVGIGSVVSEAVQIKDSAKDASTCIAYKYSAAGEHVINIKDIRRLFADTSADHTTAFDRVIGCFLDGNMEKLRIRLSEPLDLLAISNNQQQVIKQVYLELMAQIMHRASDAGISIASGQTIVYLHQVLQTDDLDLLRSWFEGTCQELIAEIAKRHKEHSGYIAETAMRYVQENYSDNALSQQSVSDHLGLSVGYFGQLFYSQTGQRFVDYLNGYRLEVAASLLATTGEKIQNISQSTGFNSVNYFNTLFKKQYHLTPREYRQTNQMI